MTPLVPKARPIRISKPSDFAPRPAPPEPVGEELPAQPRPPPELAPLNVDDVLELIGHFMPAPAEPDPVYASHSGVSYPWTRPAEAGPRILIDDLAEPPALPVQEPEPVQDDLLGWDGGNAIGSVTSAELLDRMKTDRAAVADEIGGMSSADRTYFTEMLNVELAELQQKRGAAGENLAREADIEQLLGLFARVGEM